MSRRATVLSALVVVSLVAGASGAVGAQSSSEMVTMTLYVTNTADNPVSGAELDLEWDGGSTTATTAGNGKAFADVPAGADVTVSVSHPDYVRDQPYTITDASEREVEIPVFQKSSIRLEVSGPNGSVADASVLVERGGLDVVSGRTDEDGVFRSGIIQRGDYTITVSKRGYYTERKSLTADGNVTNRVALQPGTVTVEISVVDPHFSPARPVTNANVNLTGFATGRTGGNGNTTVSAPVNVRSTLQVTKDGYRTVSRDLRIGEEDRDISVELSRVRSLTLESTNERVVAGERAVIAVTDAYGDPASGVTVTLDGEPVGTTDDDGELAVRIDDAGEHTLRATRGNVRSNEVRVEAIAAPSDSTSTATASPTPSPTATATATDTGTATETEAQSPGFTPALAVLAVLAVAFYLRRR